MTSLWVADTGNTAVYNVLHYNLVSSSWVADVPVFLQNAPIRVITGRLEGGSWVLYATSANTLWRWSTATATKSIVATSQAGTAFRGVALPPYNLALFAAASIAPSTSSSSTATPTSTLTPSSSATASASLSVGATPSSTPTGTPTMTPSVTPSNTATPTTTGTHPAAFQSSSVVVLRLGDGVTYNAATAARGIAMPLFLDEYDTTGMWQPVGSPISSLAFSTTLCTLASGKATAAPWVW